MVATQDRSGCRRALWARRTAGSAGNERSSGAIRTSARLRGLQPEMARHDELIAILEAGINVVSTAAFITGHALGSDRDRLVDACVRGRSSLFGSGMNPGLANLLGIVSANICDRIDSITITESVDSTGYDSPETELPVGFARPFDDPALPSMTEMGTAVFGDAVRLVADALGIELDDVVCEASYARTTQVLDLGTLVHTGRSCCGCVDQLARAASRPDRGRAQRPLAQR